MWPFGCWFLAVNWLANTFMHISSVRSQRMHVPSCSCPHLCTPPWETSLCTHVTRFSCVSISLSLILYFLALTHIRTHACPSWALTGLCSKPIFHPSWDQIEWTLRYHLNPQNISQNWITNLFLVCQAKVSLANEEEGSRKEAEKSGVRLTFWREPSFHSCYWFPSRETEGTLSSSCWARGRTSSLGETKAMIFYCKNVWAESPSDPYLLNNCHKTCNSAIKGLLLGVSIVLHSF